ncbi:alanyl-tRNA synthetase [Hahella chejuensis KCTC 2396]|uniref:Alanine--tRNA ligase n=1 Tax=Hahella chejuensis (strain KCTC 2396) TaxID=349521 RepID=SYA_HAHCH|nr:alanine--tRNA ligase [Hahella chejuensis]Q2SBT9.1 RecName: Full=Alanine--tRNA ligase; AltName: Full=Alanyl-tRNA synthetase; Short=AlaRS [Hahella chejuensis KCTC 2396]ABC31885.1 alanyl-tRNA synthetase [Hahella chejuensis KCTC 2396]
MKSSEIRSAFLKYFQRNGHEVVASSSLVPADDPTLLFTNAGMNQFKDVFLGKDKRNYDRATTSQKCVRAGGKHNDLENVGYTARHHTFFEMLGNFSFGDYFKREAINYAWEFLTSSDWLNIDKSKLTVTVYASDDESFDIWANEIGVPEERIIRIGDNKGAPYASDNFWQMGDTGPCGPCTEIFYDHGPHIAGGPPGSPDEDGDRFIEIWNVVFMQFNRTADGEMHPLPKPSVDTGMGLERISALMQGVHSNYEIDLFQELLAEASKVLGGASIEEPALRVIADHIRSSSFLIADGVLPENIGRGSVLRRIIRRAARYGNKVGATEPFLHKLVGKLVELMGDAYPELKASQNKIEKTLLLEEEQFAKTLDKGLKLLEHELEQLKGMTIPGKTIFTLYDTYGFPVELTNDIARERSLAMDMDGYEVEMEAQRKRAREAGSFGVDYNAGLNIDVSSEFTGYTELAGSYKALALFAGSDKADALTVGQQGLVVLDKTPFYAESGGQVGDTGVLKTDTGVFVVKDTKKEGAAIVHIGAVSEGEIKVGQTVTAEVDRHKRKATALNHSATHLLHAALRKVLGDHVAQKGSLVDPERLRFDFAHFEPMTQEQIRQVESIVNAQIRANTSVSTEVMGMDAARERGAMALFGEKYGDTVRVLAMGESDFSIELCGGTHVERTGDIGMFVIASEAGTAAGVRRIEALTGQPAENWVQSSDALLRDIAVLVKGNRETAADKVRALIERSRQLEKEVDQVKAKLASSAGSDLAASAVDVKGLKVLAAKLDGVDRKALMDTVDQLKNKLGQAVVLLASVEDGKASIVAGVTKAESAKVKAGDLVKMVAEQLGGKGGGRPDMAQGGGVELGKLDAALASVNAWVEGQLG